MSDFNTHGGYFSPDNYFRVDTGGSHEENPNGGVQVGVDEQGVPNMLEEGEPVYNDFVYSDNISADKEMIEKHNLPTKYIGKLYSKIADDFVDEAEERPNDPISNNGLNAMLVRLAEAQEEQKQIVEQKEIEDEIANLSPEELAELEAMMSQSEQTQEPVTPEQVMMPQESAAQEAPMMQGVPGVLPYALGGPMNKFAGGGTWDEYDPSSMTPEEYARINGLSLPVESVSNNMTHEEAERIAGRSLPMNVTVPDVEVQPFDFNQTLRMGFIQPATAISTKDALVMPGVTEPTIDRTRYDAMQRAAQLNAEEQDQRAAVRPTWPMYAGAVGNGLMALQTAFTPADRYTLPRYNPALPYGELSLQREVYNPADQNMLTQSILANNAAAYRSLRNSGVGPSTAAAIVAADNNATQNMGQGFLQTWDANNQRRNAVIAANNQATGQESQFDYGVNQARTNILNDAAMRNIQNDLLLQRLNNQAESEKYAALSQNLNAALTDLSNIGRTNFAANQVNSNTALYWDTLPDGTVVYRRPERPAKCGGFIKPIKKK